MEYYNSHKIIGKNLSLLCSWVFVTQGTKISYNGPNPVMSSPPVNDGMDSNVLHKV